MKKFLLFFTITFISFFNSSAQNEMLRIDSLVKEYCNNAEFNGSLLVAVKGNILFSKSCGYARVDKKIPNSEKTIFNIASVTKTFTAALIMKLQDEGRLSVQDKISRYEPQFPNGDKISIHHLLTHTSGISDYLRTEAFQSIDQTKEIRLEQMIGYFRDFPLEFEPGTKFRYSNSGYTMLGFIIEKITGKPYSVALKNMIFDPLEMKNSSFGPPLSDLNVSQGYQMYFKNFTVPSSPVHPSISYATGAIYSSVHDLYIWHKALSNGF